MSTAIPDDVHGVIATDLSDSDIQNYLDDAAYEIEAANDTSGWSTERITQLEKYYAALLIRTLRDRSIKQGAQESSSLTYEGNSIADLKRAVDRRDPSGTLAANRDTDRHITSTDS